MLEYEQFKKIFDDKIFAKSKPDLLRKVADYPDRYVGLFRPTRPEAKLLQNLLQSNEIRFGDAFEVIIREYFIAEGWQPLDRILIAHDGAVLSLDQLFIKNDEILFIEQKVRDDHDSSKKRGQVGNFERKLEALVYQYGSKVKYGIFYFIDPSLVKNKNYYTPELEKLQTAWGVTMFVSYGPHLFDTLRCPYIWHEILMYLERWRREIPELPNLNFDAFPKESAEVLNDLSPSLFRKLFADERIVNDILPVLFPTGETFRRVLPLFENSELAINQTIARSIQVYIQNMAKVGRRTAIY